MKRYSTSFVIRGMLIKTHWEKRLMIPQKAKHRITIWRSIPFLGIERQNNSTLELEQIPAYQSSDICIPIFTAASFTITKQSKCPSRNKPKNKMGVTHTMGYYCAIKRTKVLTQATTRVNHEKIIVNKPDTKGQIMYHPTSMKYLKSANS